MISIRIKTIKKTSKGQPCTPFANYVTFHGNVFFRKNRKTFKNKFFSWNRSCVHIIGFRFTTSTKQGHPWANNYLPLIHVHSKRFWQMKFRKLKHNLRFMFLPKIYYEYWSRDCDMCEVNRYDYFLGSKKAFTEMQDEEAEWADGPFSYRICSKAEYLEHQGEVHTRDRVMEAYENGRGNSIYV